jgi:hypothetical protein
MATLDGLRRKIKTSIHGRRLGLDDTGHLAGAKGMRLPITSVTSDTTGTEIPNYGLASVVTTTDDSWVLEDPVEGCQVTLATGSTSTGVHTIDVLVDDSARFDRLCLDQLVDQPRRLSWGRRRLP